MRWGARQRAQAAHVEHGPKRSGYRARTRLVRRHPVLAQWAARGPQNIEESVADVPREGTYDMERPPPSGQHDEFPSERR